MKVKTSRGIAMKLICCTALVVLASAVAVSQTPKSGALLTITSTDNSVNLKLYDSQIHSGVVQAVPSCTAANQISTDAYVLQGGSATGCDPGDAFEVTDNNPAGTRQASGLKSETKFSGFHIETHYLSEPTVSISNASFNSDSNTTTYTYTLTLGADIATGETIVVSGMAASGNDGTFTNISVGSGTFTVNNPSGSSSTGTESGTGTVSNAVCNTSKTICASPDSGFLTVTNNTGSSFTGTISLKGTSSGCGDASDSSTGTLAANASVTLALGAPGSMASPTQIDSSNCGGFNQAQPLTLTPNVTSTAFFGGGPPAGGVCAPPCKDDYQFTPLNSASGDTLSVLPVPVSAGPLGSGTFGPFPTGCVGSGCTFQSGEFGSESPIDSSPLRFSATNFTPKLACVPYADFSAAGNPVCVELQVECTNGESFCPDAASILYTVQNDYNIDANSLPNGLGGPAFIGEHAVDCPDTTFNLNIFTSYTAPSVTFDPLKGGGSGTPSCWVVAFDPSAAAVTTGNTVSTFTGFSGLFPPPTKNLVNPGASETLNFTYKNSSGTPVTNLHWCTSIFNNTGGNCNGTNNNGAPKPWVAFGTLPIDCTTGVGQPTFNETAAAGNSNLQNFGAGSYRFNLKTVKSNALLGQCFVVVAQFNTGIAVYPDQFKYAKQ